MRTLTCLLLASASLAVGQYWEFEQVDTAGVWRYFSFGSSREGKLYCTYVGSGSVIFAERDTAWHRENIATASYARLAVGGTGHVGVLCDSVCLLRTDTGWVAISTPFSTGHVALDTSGRPACLYRARDQLYEYVIFRKWNDSAWTTDTVCRWQDYYTDVYLGDLVYDGLGSARTFARIVGRGKDSRPLWASDAAYLYTLTDSGWRGTMLQGGGYGEQVFAYDLAQRGTSNVASVLWTSVGPRLACDQMTVYTGAAPTTSRVFCDSIDSRHVVYLALGRAVYASESNQWRPDTIVGDSSVHQLGGVGVDGSQPVVGLLSLDGIPWLARRLANGTQELRGNALQRRSGTTLCHGSLLAAASSASDRATLHDASGREVLDLRPGPNDISHLAPGVYFVHSTNAGRQSAVSKVILAR